MTQHNLFVYGTLKRGHGLHNYMSGGRFVAPAHTIERCLLMDGGVPRLVRRSEDPRSCRVQGEVYVVDDAMLEVLDEIEGAYDRVQIGISVDGIEKPVVCWVYVSKRDIGTPIAAGENGMACW